MKNYYKILGIQSNATPEEIDAAYERLLDWRERFPDAYTDERRQDTDTAYDTLSNPALREAYDRELREHETQGQVQGTQVGAIKERYHPPSPPTPARRGNQRAGRSAIGIAVFVIFAVIRALMRSDVLGSDNSPTPFRFVTPDYSYMYSTPRSFSGGSTSTICMGYASENTFAYAANLLSIESPMPAGTAISYRFVEGAEWYELVNSPFGAYVSAESVTKVSCFDGYGGSTGVTRPTSTPARNAIDGDALCRVIGDSGEPVTVYLEPSRNSTEEGQLPADFSFLALRDKNGWYVISGVTARQFDGGYVHLSDIDILNCN
ncbi:MAG: J domain-containing protein [Chloroflexi bacterium]|nr:J domain-containing protein [Chloroflexota bacterium]